MARTRLSLARRAEREIKRELARCVVPASRAALERRINELAANPASCAPRPKRRKAPAPINPPEPPRIVKAKAKDPGPLVLYTDGAARLHNRMNFAMRAAKENSKRGGASWAVHEGGLESSPVVAWFAHGKQVAGPAHRPAPVAKAPAPLMPDWDHLTERGFAQRVNTIARMIPGVPISADARDRDPSRVLLRDVFDAGAPWNFPDTKPQAEWATFRLWAGFAHQAGDLRLTRWDMLPSHDFAKVRDASELKRHGAMFHLVAVD